MDWFEVLVPAVVVALVVRVEALLLGPYWAWIELMPDMGDDPTSRRQRRTAMARRVAIPGVAGFAMRSAWPDVYSTGATVLVACLAALLLLWPAVIHGLPFNVRAHDGEVALVWTSLVLAFAGSAFFGATAAAWIVQDYGSFVGFVRQQMLELLFATGVVGFATTVWSRVSVRASADDTSIDDE